MVSKDCFVAVLKAILSAEIKAFACLHNGYSSKEPPHTHCLAVPLILVGRRGVRARNPPLFPVFLSNKKGRSRRRRRKKTFKRIYIQRFECKISSTFLYSSSGLTTHHDVHLVFWHIRWKENYKFKNVDASALLAYFLTVTNTLWPQSFDFNVYGIRNSKMCFLLIMRFNGEPKKDRLMWFIFKTI